MFSDIFDPKLTDDWHLAMKVGSVKQMEACEGYKFIEKFDKV